MNARQSKSIFCTENMGHRRFRLFSILGGPFRHADGYAFTFGAMGSPTTNFYSNAFERQGFGDDVRAVQQLWLAGDRDAARRRVPTAIGLGTNLIGTDDTIRGRLRLYRDAGVNTLRAHFQGDVTTDLDRQLADLARLLDLIADVNAEVSGHPGNSRPAGAPR